MTIQECVDSWVNGNLNTVIDYVLSRPTSAAVAYHAVAVNQALGGSHTFMTMLANRM